MTDDDFLRFLSRNRKTFEFLNKNMNSAQLSKQSESLNVSESLTCVLSGVDTHHHPEVLQVLELGEVFLQLWVDGLVPYL